MTKHCRRHTAECRVNITISSGAWDTSVIVVVGTDKEEIAFAVNRIYDMQGGGAVVCQNLKNQDGQTVISRKIIEMKLTFICPFVNNSLKSQKHYMNITPSEELERWYLSLWRRWIRNHCDDENHESLIGVPEQYKGNPDNTPDTLASQLDALKAIGYKNIDCFF